MDPQLNRFSGQEKRVQVLERENNALQKGLAGRKDTLEHVKKQLESEKESKCALQATSDSQKAGFESQIARLKQEKAALEQVLKDRSDSESASEQANDEGHIDKSQPLGTGLTRLEQICKEA
jgi:septal ring factor EnvC (AmiA/AmiB activator)